MIFKVRTSTFRYISNLYSHNSFPNVSHEEIHEALRESVTSGWKWKLTHSIGYMSSMLRKYREGQPISFTDFFGHLLGDVLLKEVGLQYSYN